MKSYQLIYQCGIANVIDVSEDGNPKRVLQHAFGPCEAFARGLIEMGATVSVMHSDVAGDVLGQHGWDNLHTGPGSMFGESKNPPARAAFATEDC